MARIWSKFLTYINPFLPLTIQWIGITLSLFTRGENQGAGRLEYLSKVMEFLGRKADIPSKAAYFQRVLTLIIVSVNIWSYLKKKIAEYYSLYRECLKKKIYEEHLGGSIG